MDSNGNLDPNKQANTGKAQSYIGPLHGNRDSTQPINIQPVSNQQNSHLNPLFTHFSSDGPNRVNLDCDQPPHMPRPPDPTKRVPSPSSQSIEACLEVEEAYQKSIRGKERRMIEDEVDSNQAMDFEVVPETQDNDIEDARGPYFF
ncbi:hypothetical protein RIF29_34057 [Crotalaria pallida]|uniref:Uncharacterized protein n=1 Tax=Crotalaria pallida TaxID=3830 RepID=A0AAN9EBB8_CROPI